MKKIKFALVAIVALLSGCTETIQIVASGAVSQIVNDGIGAWLMNLAGGG